MRELRLSKRSGFPEGDSVQEATRGAQQSGAGTQGCLCHLAAGASNQGVRVVREMGTALSQQKRRHRISFSDGTLGHRALSGRGLTVT